MKISAFTFIKINLLLGCPFEHSIQLVLLIFDEFVLGVNDSENDTLA